MKFIYTVSIVSIIMLLLCSAVFVSLTVKLGKPEIGENADKRVKTMKAIAKIGLLLAIVAIIVGAFVPISIVLLIMGVLKIPMKLRHLCIIVYGVVYIVGMLIVLKQRKNKK